MTCQSYQAGEDGAAQFSLRHTVGWAQLVVNFCHQVEQKGTPATKGRMSNTPSFRLFGCASTRYVISHVFGPHGIRRAPYSPKSVARRKVVVDLPGSLQCDVKADVPPFFCRTLWGRGPAMQSLRRLTRSIAATDMPVLIHGEAGTGKHILALYIHHLSDYRDEPLITVDCHRAAQGNINHLVRALNGNAAHGPARGTVLLENISELDLAGQKRLLDLLPDESRPAEENRLQARLISISRRRLDDDLREGKFIEKLYFRLNDVCLRVPPLRERREDIAELADFFLSKYGELFKRPAPELGNEALSRMTAYSWPGNIRQLENTVKEIVTSGDAQAALNLLAVTAEAKEGNGGAGLSFKAAAREASRRVERELLERALTKNRWNRKRAAQELQISYKSLLCKLKQMDLDT
jgi:two-component system response regulator AtoC